MGVWVCVLVSRRRAGGEKFEGILVARRLAYQARPARALVAFFA